MCGHSNPLATIATVAAAAFVPELAPELFGATEGGEAIAATDALAGGEGAAAATEGAAAASDVAAATEGAAAASDVAATEEGAAAASEGAGAVTTESASDAASTLYPDAPSADAMAADNIDAGGGFNPATGTGDEATAAAAAETGVTSSAAEGYGASSEVAPEVTFGDDAAAAIAGDKATAAAATAGTLLTTGSTLVDGLITGLAGATLLPKVIGALTPNTAATQTPTTNTDTSGTNTNTAMNPQGGAFGTAVGGSSGSLQGVANTLLTTKDSFGYGAPSASGSLLT
jgi:hypothetical protein